MEAYTGPEAAPRVRLLGLGNEILGDDAFGILVARQAAPLLPGVEVVCTSESGFHLLDSIQDVSRLIVVDAVETGRAAPGTLYQLSEASFSGEPGTLPHGMGLFDALALARRLELRVPREVLIVAVEAADCLTVGGPMHPAVEAAIPAAVRMVETLARAL